MDCEGTEDFPWWLGLLTTHVGIEKISALPGYTENVAVLGHLAEHIANENFLWLLGALRKILWLVGLLA